MALSKSKRAILYEMFGRKCAYCACDLPENRWHADHVEPIHRETKLVGGTYRNGGYQPAKFVATGVIRRPENERDDNYFPACTRCNLEKGCNDLETFRRGIERKIQSLRNNSSAYRHAERYGLVTVVKEKVVFYFEQFAPSTDVMTGERE